jgi:chaperone BCS1
MSFRSLKNIQLPADGNSTASLTQLPNTVLEAIIPGYALISRVLSDILGFDISALISVVALAVGLFTAGSYVWKNVSNQFLRFFSASITIDMDDPIYDHILAWASVQPSLMSVRSLRGHSAGEALDDDNAEIKVEDDFADDAIFNFNDWAAKAPPKFEPHASSGMFRHRTVSGSHWFKFDRDRERIPGGWMGTIQDKEKLALTVLGRSTLPLKELIDEARDRYLSQKTTLTTIQRPRSKEQRGRGRQAWQRVSARPSRPMATVVLDDLQKATILKDINDFLHPRTPRWYSNRGIPYRRGYLFHGPPGTGKTSLSFALAGVFGLDIYCLSLSEATLTEEDLILLFNSLPKRCVVLLEDIDTAGVLRKKEESADDEQQDSGRKARRRGAKGDSDTDKDAPSAETAAAASVAAEVAKALVSATEKQNQNNRPGITAANQGISLSGLLNAIDGVASQEGRVLVMTTNYPEKLDDALVRPGRVDLKIQFTLASRTQIKELFMRMYRADEGVAKMPTRISEILPEGFGDGDDEMHVAMDTVKVEKHMNGHARGGHSSAAKNELTPPETPTRFDNSENEKAAELEIESETDDVEVLASRFARLLPEGVFSPAEIQGFLLTRKTSPLKAVKDVKEWRDEEMRKRKKRGDKGKIAMGSDDRVESSEGLEDSKESDAE